MEGFKDLNELLTVARQINEGKYDLINVTLDPTSELFAVAQFFNDSVKKLSEVSDKLGDSYKELPAFETSLRSVINDSKKASEDVLSYVDKINFNIDSISELLASIDTAVAEENFSVAKGLIEKLKNSCEDGGEISFDIISSLEFKELAQSRIENLLGAVNQLEEQLAQLIIALGLQQQVISADTVDKLKDPKEILQDQDLVNKLLQEFGM